jgi:hypothetical protein
MKERWKIVLEVVLWVLLCGAGTGYATAAVTTTTVQGTVYRADGSAATGTLIVSWPAFSTARNQAVAAGTITVPIGQDGFATLQLAPNAGAYPAGTYYTAVYHLSDGTVSKEYWVVPTSSPASIASVRAQLAPATVAVQTVTKQYVDSVLSAASSGSLPATGGTMTGPLVLDGDPTSDNQAATKHYADSIANQTVPVTGGVFTGTVTGPLMCSPNTLSYNVLCYGADPTGQTDSTAAIQSAINAAAGKPVYMPAGVYTTSAPLTYHTTGVAAGLKLYGDSFGKTFIEPSASFAVPAGSAPAVIDVQGVVTPGGYGQFQRNGYIRDLYITPRSVLPACTYNAYWTNCIAGISLEGFGNSTIENVTVTQMSGDGILLPARWDIGTDPDWWGSVDNTFQHLYLHGNFGWGFNEGASQAGSNFLLSKSDIQGNGMGGVRATGWTFRIEDNAIASNGCSSTGYTGTAGAPVSCNNLKTPAYALGPGVLIDRADANGSGPLNGTIEGNEFDSNALAHIQANSVTGLRVSSNRFIHHNSGYVYNTSFPGWQNVPVESVRLGVAGAGAVNAILSANYFRSDSTGACAYPTPCAGVSNPGTDPPVQGFNLVNATQAKLGENIMAPGSNTSNFGAYTSGGGVIPGVLTVTNGSLTAAKLASGGVGLTTMPRLVVAGGDTPSSSGAINLTIAGGVITGCTTAAAGQYTNKPLVGVFDQTLAGTGAVLSAGFSGGQLGACSVVNGGSGYSALTVATVSPQCAVQPVVTATSSLGVTRVVVTNGGNYGAYVPGATPPMVTVTVAGGTGWAGNVWMAPVNQNSDPTLPANVVWEVTAVDVINPGYGFVTPTVTFSAGVGQAAATGKAWTDKVLNPTLTVQNAGSGCASDLTLLAVPVAYPALNTQNNQITEKNLTVSVPTSAQGVQSAFGRMGSIVAAAGDYTAAQVTNAAATNVANTFAQPQTMADVISGGPLVDVRKYGAVADGATDNCTAMTNAATAAGGFVFGVVWIPPVGTFQTTCPLVLPATVSLQVDGVLQAKASMVALVTTGYGSSYTWWSRRSIYGHGRIDANGLATTAVWLRQYRQPNIENVNIYGIPASGTGIRLGDSSGSGAYTGSYGASITGVTWAEHSSVGASGSICIWADNGTDSKVMHTDPHGCSIGVQDNVGGSRYTSLHAWDVNMTVCFDDYSMGTFWTADQCDTPTMYGWHIRNLNTHITAARAYLNGSYGVNNGPTAFYFEQSDPQVELVDAYVIGADVNHNWAADTNAQTNHMILDTVIGVQYSNVTAKNFGRGLLSNQLMSGSIAILNGGYYENQVTVSAGAAPQFNLNAGTVQVLTLSANVTSATVTGPSGGYEKVDFHICQPGSGGPFTFAWPAGTVGGGTVGTAAGKCSLQLMEWDGTKLRAMGPMQTNE